MGHLPEFKIRVAKSPNLNGGQVFAEFRKDVDEETVYFAVFNVNLIITLDLGIIPKLLTDRTMFWKRDSMREVMGECAGVRAFGNYGILVDPGTDVWAAKRRILDPAFTRSYLRTTMEGMNKVANNLMKVFEMEAESGRSFDISESLDRSAFEAVSLCGFHWSDEMIKNHGDDALKMARVIVEVMGLVFKYQTAFKMPWAHRDAKREFREGVLPVRELNKRHLTAIKDGANTEESILSRIIQANDCSDDLNLEDLIDDYNVFLAAGMETTSITMACAVWYVSMNRHVYEKVQSEVDEVFGDRDEISFDDVSKLVYTEMIVKETLRLRAPVYGTGRQCKFSDATVNGAHFPKGTQFFVPFHDLHLDARYWKDPETFNPERFSSANVKSIRPYTFMPFSTGPRNCIGKNFAILEMKVILANLFRKFLVYNANPDEKELPMIGNITIRPLNGVNVRVVARS